MSDRETAYHEAGHVIACDEMGVHHGGLSIVPHEDGTIGRAPVDGDDGFYVRPGTDPFSPENEAGYRAWAEEQAVIDYAGHAAVVAALGIGSMSDESGAAHGAGEDFEKARARLGGDADRIKRAKARAVEIVTARRDDVAKLATVVLEHGYLDAQEADFALLDSPFLQLSLSRRVSK